MDTDSFFADKYKGSSLLLTLVVTGNCEAGMMGSFAKLMTLLTELIFERF
jgi:hypothetical protein